MDKKSIFMVIFLIFVLIAVSGCVNYPGNVNKTISIKNYTGSGISLNYPSDWMVNNDTSYMILFNKNSGINTYLSIQVMLMSGGFTSKDAIPPGNFTKVSNGTRTIDNVTAHDVIYKSDLLMGGTTFFEKDGKTIIITYQAPLNEFEQEKVNFDTIINSIKLQ
jgi:hypothetical protein